MAGNIVFHKTPIVTVVMIFLDAEAFIQEAIDSIFAQTYTEWELILVDDGSVDRSTKIALQAVAEHPDRVFYRDHYDHQNRGMSASRNLGISQARGKYLAFLDADDVWLPQTLECQVQLLETRPNVGMVYGLSRFWYSWTGKPEDSSQDYLQTNRTSSGTMMVPPEGLTRFLARSAALPCMPNLLVRIEVVKEFGGFEEEFHDLFEDQVFYAKVALATPVLVDDRYFSLYRQHPGSICAVGEKQGRIQAAQGRYLSWLEGYLKQTCLDDPRLWKAYHLECWRQRNPRLYRFIHSIRRSMEKRGLI